MPSDPPAMAPSFFAVAVDAHHGAAVLDVPAGPGHAAYAVVAGEVAEHIAPADGGAGLPGHAAAVAPPAALHAAVFWQSSTAPRSPRPTMPPAQSFLAATAPRFTQARVVP